MLLMIEENKERGKKQKEERVGGRKRVREKRKVEFKREINSVNYTFSSFNIFFLLQKFFSLLSLLFSPLLFHEILSSDKERRRTKNSISFFYSFITFSFTTFLLLPPISFSFSQFSFSISYISFFLSYFFFLSQTHFHFNPSESKTM